MLLVIAMGVFCYEKLPRNEDPAFTIKTAVVSAQWPGASVTDTTRLLTDTLEKSCRKRPGWIISKVKPVPEHRYPCQSP
jgi:multidrug efflux pump subunit AcrB